VKLLLICLGVVLVVPLVLGLLFMATMLTLGGLPTGSAPSRLAQADIPAEALRDYQDAAATCQGLSWTVLAGVGKVESDHGRSSAPGVHSGQNAAGAEGPMQFLPATWAAYHVPGLDDVYALRDAAFAAARYLCASGAGIAGRLRDAVFAYNHAWWYVDEVLGWAARYAADVVQAPAAVGQPGDPFAGACRPVVTQPYGPTALAGEPVVNGVRFHTGIDLACPQGTPVHSLTDGLAHVTAGCADGEQACGGGFGNNVVVEAVMSLPGELAPQRYFVRYAHLLGGPALADGSVVHAGDILGLEGATGFATGPHLHFEVDRGAPTVLDSVDPAPLLEVG
jgi:Peptidase family M23